MTHGSSTSDVKIAISDQDLIDLLEDNLNGQAGLFFSFFFLIFFKLNSFLSINRKNNSIVFWKN